MACLLAGTATAEVVAHDDTGFMLRLQATADAPPARVWASLSAPGEWWDDEHTYSGRAQNMTLELRAGSCFCERWEGGEIEHLRVVYVSPGNRQLVMVGGLGPLLWQGASGSLVIRLEAAGDGTRVQWEYRVSGFEPKGWAATAPLVDAVLAQQLDRLVRHAAAAP